MLKEDRTNSGELGLPIDEQLRDLLKKLQEIQPDPTAAADPEFHRLEALVAPCRPREIENPEDLTPPPPLAA